MKNDKSVSTNATVVDKKRRLQFMGSMQNFAQNFFEEFIKAEREKERAIILVRHN